MTRYTSADFRRITEGLSGYIAACEKFVGAFEELERAIEAHGSDPMGVLSLIADKPEGAKVTGRIEPTTERPAFQITETVITALPEQEAETAPVLPAPEPTNGERKGADAYMNLTKPEVPRLTKRTQAIQTWLYQQLIDGPLAKNELELRAKAAGHTWYGVSEARKHTSDIKIQVIGMRGPHFWYIEGQEDKLPQPVPMGEVNAEVANGVGLRPDEVKVLNAMPGTLAELIGRTGMKPLELKRITERLRMTKNAMLDKTTSTWKTVQA